MAITEEWTKELKKDDFPEVYHEMIDIIGVELTLKLALHYKGQQVYFGHIDAIATKKKYEYIRKNFDGGNHKALARATGYSEVWVYEILRAGKDERQQEMF